MSLASGIYGKSDRESRPLAELGIDQNATAVHFDDTLGNREPQPRSAFRARRRAIHLLELFEDFRLIGGRDARAAVAHRQPE